MSRWIFTILALGWAGAHADLAWNFAQQDNRPGGQGGIYAYIYPSDPGSHHTPAHIASLARISDSSGNAAKLTFVLDGAKYPSAGFGLMFSESQPLDLRSLTAIRLYLSSDKPRKVRLAFASRIPSYKAAFDTGVSFGRDLKAGPNGAAFNIPVGDVAYPAWARDTMDIPSSVSNSDILASTWAIQLNVSCETASGVCAQDSGWLRLDSLRLVGVGTEWQAPAQGNCAGDSVDLSRFGANIPKKNGLGGWWYAYTDLSSSDTAAQGLSRILSAPDTSNPGSWVPDSAGGQAHIAFHLLRKGSYSGYADLETQFGAPDGSGHPVLANLTGLRSISFDLAFDSTFSGSLGGITLHAKKSGKAYSEGKDHQIRIPYGSGSHHWCLDFDSLHQPTWTSWVPFTPDSLLALSWEVKLQGNSSEAIGGFSLRDIKLWSASVGVRSRSNSVWSLRRTGASLELTRPLGGGTVVAELVDARGHILDRTTGDGQTNLLRLRIPASSSVAWVRTLDARGVWTRAIAPAP